MTVLKGKGIVAGKAKGPALVTKMPMNFTAAFTKPMNVLPAWRSRVYDRHHDLYRKNVKNSVLIFPAAIGSTYTGLMLLELMHRRVGPAALIVQTADPLLVSGAILADVWYGRGVPVVEYQGEDIFDAIGSGRVVEVDGATGTIEAL